MLEFTTLGTVGLHSGNKGPMATVLAQPKRLALLLYLAIEAHDGFVSRDRLLTMFWSESDETRARAALRQALQFLRRALGETAFRQREDDAIGVDPDVLRCDAVTFRRALQAGEFAEALALYDGPFADGLTVDDAVEFDQWLSQQRTQFLQDAALAAARLSDSALARGETEYALSLARRAQVLQPLDEVAHRRLLRTLDASGDRASVAVVHAAFVILLQQELEVEPSLETLQLFTQLRDREAVHNAPDALVKSNLRPPSVAPPASASPVVSEYPAAQTSAWHPWAWVAATLIPVLLFVAIAVWPSDQTDPGPLGTAAIDGVRHVVVVPFRNETGDSSLASIGRMTADWVTAGLSRLDGVAVVPVTAAMAIEKSGDIVDRVASTELAADFVVSGAVYRTGNSLHFQVRVADGRTQTLLRPVETVSVSADSIMVGINKLRSRIVAVFAPLTDSVSHLRRAAVPPTYESYQAYVTGLETFVTGDPVQALAHFRRASQDDSAFAMPRLAASIMYLNIDSIDAAVREVAAVEQLRPTLGPLEAATLDMVQSLMRHDLSAAHKAVAKQARIAPGSIGEYMVAELARRRNRPTDALKVLRTLGQDRGELRGWRPYWRELTYALHMTGAHTDELSAARQARSRYPDDRDTHTYVIRALAALADRAALTTSLAESESGLLRVIAASEWIEHGHGDSRSFVQEQIAWMTSRAALQPVGNAIHAQLAWLMLLDERKTDAHRIAEDRVTAMAMKSLSAAERIDRIGMAGVMAAAAGDHTQAAVHTDGLVRDTQRLSPAMQHWLAPDIAMWRSAIAARAGDTAGSIALLRTALQAGLSADPWLLAHPAFMEIRQVPAFQQLLKAQ